MLHRLTSAGSILVRPTRTVPTGAPNPSMCACSRLLHAESVPLHIMDLPGVLGHKQQSNAMAMEEVEAGLRAVPQHMGTGHTVVVVPSHGREIDMEPIIGKLCETQVLKVRGAGLAGYRTACTNEADLYIATQQGWGEQVNRPICTSCWCLQ